MRTLLLALAFSAVLAPLAHAEADPRAEVTIQASPLECAAMWGRVHDVKIESDAQSDALALAGKACDFPAIQKTVDAKHGQPTDAEFAGPRRARHIARDALVQLSDWLAPTKERPLAAGQDTLLRPLRFEFREVLAGRDPYPPAPAPKK